MEWDRFQSLLRQWLTEAHHHEESTSYQTDTTNHILTRLSTHGQQLRDKHISSTYQFLHLRKKSHSQQVSQRCNRKPLLNDCNQPRTMKILLLLSSLLAHSLLTAANTPSAQSAIPTSEAKGFLPGEKVPALTDITMIKGDLPKSLKEDGKIYLIECWAVWCGPCVAQIPHLNALHNKFHDQGLEVIGMNVFENDLEKVSAFVEKKGDSMSYHVAFSGGKKSSFASTWMIPNGHRAIPHAFIIKDGKLLFSTHPANITESMIEQLLAGTFDTSEMVAKQRVNAKRAKLRHSINTMAKADDWAGIEKATKASIDEGEIMFTSNYVIALAKQSKFDTLCNLLEADNGLVISQSQVAHTIANYIDSDTAGFADFATKAMEAYVKNGDIAEGMLKRPSSHLSFTRYLYLSGDKDASLKMLDKSLAELEANTDGDQGMNTYFGNKMKGAKAAIEKGDFPPIMSLPR